MTIKRRRHMCWGTAGVCAALLAAAFPLGAYGQAQVNQDGRARDANPRLGYGGLNGNGANPLTTNQGQPGVVGNQIIQNTVSNGKGFQGFEPIPVPGAFQGATPLATYSMDQFIKNSTGVAQPYQPGMLPNTSVPFYAQSLGVAPPPGYISPANMSGNYIPAGQILPRSVQDQRLGTLLGAPTSVLPAPGELMMPGAVDPNTNTQTYYVASELFGIKQFAVGSASDQFLLGSSNSMQQRIVLNQLQLDPRAIAQMQQELRDLTPGFAPPSANLTPSQPTNAAMPSQSMSGASSVGTGQLPDTPLSNSLAAGAQLTAPNLSAQQGTVASYHASPQAAQQSTLYGQMQQLLEAFYSTDPGRAIQAAAAIHNLQAPKPQSPNGSQPGELPGSKTPGSGAVLPNAPGKGKPAPVLVGSLAQGVSVKGLHEVLQRAEEFMKAGKFSTAISTYETAEEVAKGQPVISLVWIGMANADLGAGYYLRAANQLQQAFAKDPALLMAKYDLHTFIGDDRLEMIIKELKAAAAKDPSNPAPIFLLAYVSYNTNNDRAAAAYLVLAEQRSGGKDPIYKLIRDHWTLPEETPAANPTKK